MAQIKKIKCFSLQNQIGLSLIEVMLVLAVAASMLVFGIRQYQQFKLQQDIRQVQQTIDSLFVALGHYYQAYCGSGLSLDPAQTPDNPFVILPSDLVAEQFLPANWNAIKVPFVSSYITQLNLNDANVLNVQGCWNFGTYTCGSLDTLPPTSTGYVYTWRIQVAIQLTTGANAQAYKAALGADCLSTLNGDAVTPCSSTSTGNFLVWERWPSFASQQIVSNLWMSMQQLKQFNIQYTHDQMYELNNGPWETSAGVTGTGAQPYLCGS